jgi:MscS family membrane protein
VDTSSPRATLESFIALTEETTERYLAFRDDPGPMTQRSVRQLSEKVVQLFDLSEVAPATRTTVGVETFFLLWDVIGRIELPDFAEIPDYADMQGEALPRWRIPGTEISIERVAEGVRTGEFLFSAATVARAPLYYELTLDLPYQRPMRIENVYRLNQNIAGWMLPPALIAALPRWATPIIFGQVLWKWVALLMLIGLAVVALVAVSRWARSQTRVHHAHEVKAYLRAVSAPICVFVVGELFWIFAVRQINVTGPATVLPDLIREVARGVSAVWVVWVSAHWVAERIIASPQIPTNSLHANLIRFSARFVGMLGATVLAFRAAQDVGVPVYGLIAGAGVGGLAIALAVRSTLENLVGTLNLYADRPVRIGDTCRYGSDPLSVGKVEEIGLRSTRIRGADRSVTTIPNAEFANMHLVNLGQRDRMLMNKTIGLRYETTPDQLRLVLAMLREMLRAHPRVSDEKARVRATEFGPSGLEVSLQAHILTSETQEFLAIQEELILKIMQIVEEAGTDFAFPSTTVYQASDHGIDRERQAAAEKRVREWAAAGALPAHGFSEQHSEVSAAAVLPKPDVPPSQSGGG